MFYKRADIHCYMSTDKDQPMDYQRVLDHVKAKSLHKEEKPLDGANITDITSKWFSESEQFKSVEEKLKKNLM